MEDRISRGSVTVSAAVIANLRRICTAGAKGLAIKIGGVIAVGAMYPLMRMEMVDVVLLGTSVEYPEFYMITEIGMIDIRWIIRVKSFRGNWSGYQGVQNIWVYSQISRIINHHGRIAHCPRTQEEFLVLALGAVPHRTNPETIGNNLRTCSAGTVINAKTIPHTM
ncbi:MAG: hypothetical protein HUU09_02430 [Candidatus Jettenia caeni]|nr:hypothetical protein [Candidatus Jettenia caeni]